MTCTLCQDPRCDADAGHEDHDGLTDWIATARAMDRCRVTLADQAVQLRDRALRAEAEVRALCDDPEALTPHLPDGWAWDAAVLRWRGPHDLYLTWDVRLCRNKRGAFCPRRRRDGLVAAMVDAVADVVAAEGDR